MTQGNHGRNGSGIRFARAALAAGAAAAIGGCAGAPVYKGANETYVLTVPVSNGCPQKPRFDVNCGPGREDCAHVRRGHSVKIVSEPAGERFAVQFDPFGASRIDIEGERVLSIAQNVKAGTYTFIVVGRQGCPAADPQIILE